MFVYPTQAQLYKSQKYYSQTQQPAELDPRFEIRALESTDIPAVAHLLSHAFHEENEMAQSIPKPIAAGLLDYTEILTFLIKDRLSFVAIDQQWEICRDEQKRSHNCDCQEKWPENINKPGNIAGLALAHDVVSNWLSPNNCKRHPPHSEREGAISPLFTSLATSPIIDPNHESEPDYNKLYPDNHPTEFNPLNPVNRPRGVLIKLFYLATHNYYSGHKIATSLSKFLFNFIYSNPLLSCYHYIGTECSARPTEIIWTKKLPGTVKRRIKTSEFLYEFADGHKEKVFSNMTMDLSQVSVDIFQTRKNRNFHYNVREISNQNNNPGDNLRQDQRWQLLDQLCDKNRANYHIEYKAFFSNHLPHALISLFGLNAPADRLNSYFKQYSQEKLEPRSPLEGWKITRDNWRDYLGRRKGFEDIYNYFLAEYEANNRDYTVLINQYYPELIKGVSHAALHPLIHLGWGLIYDNQTTVLEGLAYSMFSYNQMDRHLGFPYEKLVANSLLSQNLQQNEGKTAETAEIAKKSVAISDKNDKSTELLSNYNSKSIFELLPLIHSEFSSIIPQIEDKILRVPYSQIAPSGNFQRKMIVLAMEYEEKLYNLDLQLQLKHLPQSPEQCYLELLELSLLLFSVSNNGFFILHIVTAMYALGQLLPLLNDRNHQIVALRYAVKYALAVFIVEKMPGYEKLAEINSPEALKHKKQHYISSGDSKLYSWEELTQSAIDSAEEHTQKLVFVCWQEKQRGIIEEDWLKHVAWLRLASSGDAVLRRKEGCKFKADQENKNLSDELEG
jgi:hypothetical protein